MWIFTKEGFFSAVHDKYCNTGEVTVRARCREDLEKVLLKLNLTKTAILKIDHADYRYRAKISKVAWADYLKAAGLEIDYPNFKNVLDLDAQGRNEAYYKCWKALYRWQERQS